MSRSLTGPVCLETEIKRSRFIAHAGPAADEAQARAFLARVCDASASHNCWAYKAGDQYRFDDDGEPGGTAGRPMLQAIDSQGFDRVVVVVIRHFGGIKLGTGGLARAYGGTAAELLRQAESIPLVKHVRLMTHLPFDCIGAAHQAMNEHQAEKLDENYASDGVELIVSLPESGRAAFAAKLRDLARGNVTIRRI